MPSSSTKTPWLAAVCLVAAFPVLAQTCGDWSWSNPLPQGSALSGVAWGAGRFVAVGDGGTVLTSADGESWKPGLSRVRANLRDVAWTGSQFVAVGEAGTVAVSPDGTWWNALTPLGTSALTRLAWSGSRLVAVGDAGAVFSSPDGSHW